MEVQRKVHLTFVPAKNEADNDYLAAIRAAASEIRSAGGTSIMPALGAMTRADGHIAVIATYTLQLAQVIASIVGPALGVWLQGRAGRKLHLKVDEIEVEASTMAEIDQLLKRIKALKAEQERPDDEA